MTYKALGRSIANYAAPVWGIHASKTNIGKIQCAQNEALRIITGSHKMSSIDHIQWSTLLSGSRIDSTGLLHRSDRINVVGRAGQTKRCLTACGVLPQSAHTSRLASFFILLL